MKSIKYQKVMMSLKFKIMNIQRLLDSQNIFTSDKFIRYFDRFKKKDERNIEEIMTDISENHKEYDYRLLYSLLKNQEVFIPITSRTIPNGVNLYDKFNPNEEDSLKIKSIEGPNDQPLIPVATKNTSAILNKSYISMDWKDFLNIILKIDDTDGAFLDGEMSWVRFEKRRIAHILDRYDEEEELERQQKLKA